MSLESTCSARQEGVFQVPYFGFVYLIITFFQNKLACIKSAPEAGVLCSQAVNNVVGEGVFIMLHS